MKRLAILGSTGSIGRSTLSVVRSLGDSFGVSALAAGSNIDLLEEQAREFRPRTVAVKEADAAGELDRRLGGLCRVLHGSEGRVAVATHDEVLIERYGRRTVRLEDGRIVEDIPGARGLP